MSSCAPAKRILCNENQLGTNSSVGITPRQFEQLQTRLKASRPTPAPVQNVASVQRQRSTEVILGIDPSLRATGYGVLRVGRPYSEALAHGTIHCPNTWERSRCFVKIAEELRDVLRTHHPTVCVIEALFYAQNLQTALIMGEARGAILVTLATAGLEIYEIAPRKVKQAIVGYGAAQKLAVAKMVQRLLRLPEPPAPDAADALALALTRAQEQGRYSLASPRRI